MKARVAVHFIGVGMLFLAALDTAAGSFSPIPGSMDLAVGFFGLGLISLVRVY